MRVLKRSLVLFLAATAVCLLVFAARAGEGQTVRVPSSVYPVDRLGEAHWKARHEAKKARLAEGNVDLLLLGDSITNYWDTTGEAVEEYYYGDRNCVDLGFGSDRTEHLLWRLNDSPMDKIHPKAAMILIGINNIRANTEEEIAQGIKANVDKMVTLYPDIKILLLAMFPINGHDDPMRGKIAATNALLPEMYKDYPNVKMMDISYLWLDENGDIPKELMYDGVHPTEYGYKVWGAEVEPVIAEMLGDTPKPKME